MDKVYVECCTQFSTAFENWNETFQLALEYEDSTEQLAAKRQEEIYRVEKAFEEEVVAGAMHIVSMDGTGPRPLPKHLLCYREKNVFYRILPDIRSGRNYVASLRGVLQSRSEVLTVPLTAVFLYRGMPVLAQALIPLAKEPTKRFGELSANSEEIESEMEFIADAINTPLPDQIVCEVYEGLDGRFYVTNTNTTTIALDESTLIDGPIKRCEMLSLCPCVTATCEDTLNVLRNPSVLQALNAISQAPLEEQQGLLCNTLHFYGVNLCLLKGVIDVCREGAERDGEEWEEIKRIVAIEMLARTVKQEFYLEVQSKRLGDDDLGLSRCFALHLKDAFDVEAHAARFIALVMKKYAIANVEGEDAELLDAIYRARRDHRSAVVERVSLLVGARATTTDDALNKTVVWVPLIAGRVAPRLCDPKMMVSLDPLYRSLQTNEEHNWAFCTPLRIKVALWEARYGDALLLAQKTAEALEAKYGVKSLRYLYAKRTFCKLLFAVPSVENVRDGCESLVAMLHGFETLSCELTRARCHVEVGCWLLGASHVVDMVAEATRHFQLAEKLLPLTLRSSYGAWLFIQPSLGLLRCRQANHGGVAVSVQPLTSDAVYLSRIVAPADYFVEYLWELGMELAVDESYEQATKVLTAAVSMAKKVKRSQLDARVLVKDTLAVFRKWDPAKYGAYCDAIAQM